MAVRADDYGTFPEDRLAVLDSYFGRGKPAVQVTHTHPLGGPKRKCILRLCGAGISRPVVTHSNTINNALKALDERVYHTIQDGVLKPVIQPSRNAVDWLYGFRSELIKHLPVLQPMTREQFVSRYVGRKARVYQDALESLQVQGVSLKDSRLSGFVKYEKVFNKPGKRAVCRYINPRSPRYNMELGCLIGHCEKPLFKAIARAFKQEHVVLKGLDARKMATVIKGIWDEFSDPVAVGMDASRFDQHVSVPMLEFEHEIWTHMVPGRCRKQLRWLLSMQIDNRGVGKCVDGRIKYRIRGCRMSGDMNTSSGNCLIMCALLYAYAQSKKCKHRLINNGDDSVVFLERRDLRRFLAGLEAWFKNMGFTMAVEEPVYDLEGVEFCQTRPVFTERGWVMARNLRNAIPKDLCSTCDIRKEKVFRRWSASVRACGLALTDGLPVWREFYSMFPQAPHQGCKLRTSSAEQGVELAGLMGSGLWRLSEGLVDEGTEVTLNARISFWKATGLLPWDQRWTERRFNRTTLSWTPPAEVDEAPFEGTEFHDVCVDACH